jgi:hypothetical protein
VVWAGRKARSLVEESTSGESEDDLAANQIPKYIYIYIYICIFFVAKTDLKRSRKTITSEHQKF